jgi:hypothetical protein
MSLHFFNRLPEDKNTHFPVLTPYILPHFDKAEKPPVIGLEELKGTDRFSSQQLMV